ncbi:nitrilase-related carbon-nitrogen hydrolase, partial [Synechococcus lacustris]|uniref:nitrilase-related carbon-nitrogen hydrolase n=1 Tax=Synechococcus lacustris TaxID=2116544 RepID=UPI0028F44FA0
EWSGLSAVGGLQPGAASRLLVLPEPIGRLAAAICYEISDGEALARATSLGAEWLLTVANLDPYPIQLQKQFISLAQLRAIETGRWLVSVANTGPTAAVDPSGRVIKVLPSQKAGVGSIKIERISKQTLYVVFTEKPLLMLLVISALCCLRFNKSLRSDPL